MTREEQAIIDALYEAKSHFKPYAAYCTAAAPLTFRRWNGRHPVEDNTIIDTIPPGTTVRIVMVSRLGDCGLTDNLSAQHGYHCRVDWDSGLITDIRWAP